MLKYEVIDQGLCTRCGSCVGVCPEKALAIHDDMGACIPERTGQCKDCSGLCYFSCSGRYVDFPALNQTLHGGQPNSYLLGNYSDLWVAHSTDQRIRHEGASGGIVTAVLKHLFDTGRIEGAYVMGMDDKRPYMPKPMLVHSYEQAQRASQSKYVVSPYNILFNEIPAKSDPLAYVGLPCQVHSLRKLQQLDYPLARRFHYIIGTYCGNIMHFSSIRAFLAKKGVRNLSEILSLSFRAGQWPGKMRIELRNGRVIQMPKFHANYLIPFHIMKRCLLCVDLTNEFADISVGDAWAPVYEQKGEGFSIMVVRTKKGKQLADEMIQVGNIDVTRISYNQTIAMHSHGLDLKKRGAFLRIRRCKAKGKEIPEYGFTLKSKVPVGRAVMELLMRLTFLVCWTSLGQKLINCIPDRLIGASFKLVRTCWKAATHTTKRTGLGSIRFSVDKPGGRASADWTKL